MEALGIERGDYVVKVNNRKVLDGVMEAIGLAGEENAGNGSPYCARSINSIGLGSTELRSCSAKDAKTKAVTSPKAPDLD